MAADPVCVQCGRTGWSIAVGGVPAAPLTLEQIHATHSETSYFCDTLCLLRWAVEDRERIVKFWQDQSSRSAGDVNNVLRAPLIDRILIGRWWRKRVEGNFQ